MVVGDEMKEKFLNSTMNFLKKYKNYSKDDIEKLEYGLEGIYLTLTKLVVIFLLAFLLNIVPELIVVLIFFNIIRFTGFGFHAQKSYQCLIFSIFCFLFVPLFFLNFQLPEFIYILICFLCVFSYLLFAPADTVKRPLLNSKKRKIRKIITVSIGIVYSTIGIIYFNTWISNLLISVLLIQSIIVNPLTYKFFKQPYNNYKTYKFD